MTMPSMEDTDAGQRMINNQTARNRNAVLCCYSCGVSGTPEITSSWAPRASDFLAESVVHSMNLPFVLQICHLNESGRPRFDAKALLRLLLVHPESGVVHFRQTLILGNTQVSETKANKPVCWTHNVLT